MKENQRKMTPEQALEMLRDWRDAKSYSSFSNKWGNPNREKVALEALEIAIAEIELQKLRADKAEADLKSGTVLSNYLQSCAEIIEREKERADKAEAQVRTLVNTYVHDQNEKTDIDNKESKR